MKNIIKLNNQIAINLPKLIESRLFIQANSGGGESWAIRRIIEQAFGKVQIIVLDPEGEFTNLRQKYDFVFAGKDGDAPAEPRSASLLARRLLELKASAIIDLYELSPQERKRFIRLFCEAMVNAPKELWHDCLVIIDEAHVFAPEKGESESMMPIIDLATRGRKRGYCVVLATQRMSKLHKDASAECNNKLIGRASQDIDMKRAADELGFTSRDKMLSLRLLKPGEFYVFGPAIFDEVKQIKVGDVSVKPPPRGVGKQTPPPPTDKVKKILAKLADLPQEAEKEASTINEMRQKIVSLERENRILQKTPGVNPEMIEATVAREVEKARKEIERNANTEIEKERKEQIKINREWQTLLDSWIRYTEGLRKVLTGVGIQVEKMNEMSAPESMAVELPKKEKLSVAAPVRPAVAPKPRIFAPKRDIEVSSNGVSNPEQRILNAIAWMKSIGIEEPEQTAVAFLADYKYGGGAFNNPRGSLRTKGLVEYRGNNISLTEAGRQLAETPEMPLTTEELHRKVLDRLPGPERKIMSVLLEVYPEEISNEELAQRAGYVAGGGGYNNPCGRLWSLGLIEYRGQNVVARSILFLE